MLHYVFIDIQPLDKIYNFRQLLSPYETTESSPRVPTSHKTLNKADKKCHTQDWHTKKTRSKIGLSPPNIVLIAQFLHEGKKLQQKDNYKESS